MSSPKIVILVLVAVAIVFVVTVGVGSWPRRATEYDPNSGWVKALKAIFPPRSLDPERIDSTCFSEHAFTIPAEQFKCEVHIRKGKASICNLKLKLVEGKAKLSYEPSPGDKNAQPIEKDLDPNKPFTLQIFKHGGKLTLTNEGDPCQPCRIEIDKIKGRDS